MVGEPDQTMARARIWIDHEDYDDGSKSSCGENLVSKADWIASQKRSYDRHPALCKITLQSHHKVQALLAPSTGQDHLATLLMQPMPHKRVVVHARASSPYLRAPARRSETKQCSRGKLSLHLSMGKSTLPSGWAGRGKNMGRDPSGQLCNHGGPTHDHDITHCS